MLMQGILGRGLILEAAAGAGEVLYGGVRYERRFVTIDVEGGGRPPYQTRLTLSFPPIVEALPGTLLDLRVNPSDLDDIEVLGPVGACAWLGEAAAMPGQTYCRGMFVMPDPDGVVDPPMSPDDDVDAAAIRAMRGSQGTVALVVVLVVVALSVGIWWMMLARR
jgi:hypothetical protein